MELGKFHKVAHKAFKKENISKCGVQIKILSEKHNFQKQEAISIVSKSEII